MNNSINGLSIDTMITNHFLGLCTATQKKILSQEMIDERESELTYDIYHGIDEAVSFLWTDMLLHGFKLSPAEAYATILDAENMTNDCDISADTIVDFLNDKNNAWSCRHRLLMLLSIPLLKNTNYFSMIAEYLEKIGQEGEMNVCKKKCSDK